MPSEPLLCKFIDEVYDLPIEYTDFKYFLTEKIKVFSPHERFSDKKVLMLTRKHDREADLVGIGLLARGVDYARLNIDDIPDQLRIRYIVEQASDSKVEFIIRDEVLETSNISVVWLREFDIKAINFPYGSRGENEVTNRFSFQQWEAAWRTLQSSLRGKWISTHDATLKAANRLEQLLVAKTLGFNIPATLITTDPHAAIEFYHDHGDDLVLKAFHHHGVELHGKVYSIYTHRVTNEDLLSFNDLICAPCILQERLQKRSELRVTVVGERVFAAEIDSQSTIKGREDMHRCPISELPKRAVELGNTINEKCIDMIKRLGLSYGAIDFVLDKNGHIMFLEVNPTGDWYWIEQQTGLPITEAMVDLIEESARSCPD